MMLLATTVSNGLSSGMAARGSGKRSRLAQTVCRRAIDPGRAHLSPSRRFRTSYRSTPAQAESLRQTMETLEAEGKVLEEER